MSNKLNSTRVVADFLPKKQHTVMLVEDSEVDRAVYRRYLELDGEYQYTLIEAETGEEAMISYQQSPPDIILLDYLLPDQDGLEWLSQLQQQNCNHCPVIVMTGQGDDNIALQFIKMGAADYLIKNQITAEKLRFSINKSLFFQQLQQKNEDLVAELTARNNKLKQSNQLYRAEISRREKLQEIITNVPVVIYAKDADAATLETGKIWLVNQEFQRVFAVAESDVVGKSDREFFPPTIAAEFATNDRLVIESKQPLTTEENVYHADGKLHTYLSLKFPIFDGDRQISSIVGIATDITAKKQVQTELLQSEIRFRHTFEQAAMGIAHISPEGQWLRVNQKTCQIVGYTKEELLLKTFQDITHPDDLDKDMRYVRQILADEIKTYSIEKRYIHKNQAYIWVELTVSLVRNQNGEPDYFISVIEDISDRKSLEFSLQKSLQRLSNLHEIDKAILAAAQPKAIATTVIENIQNLSSCQRISIVTFDWDGSTASILATKGMGNRLLGQGFQSSLESWQEVIDQLQQQKLEQDHIITCPSQATLLPKVDIALKPTELKCFIAFPLRTKDNLLGILKLWVEHPETVTTEELTMVAEISSQLAIALQQARLYKKTQNYTLELEARVAQRTAQIEEINRELKAFTYSISHDLKAPLRAIQGFASALQEDYDDCLDDLGQEYTARLISSAQQMTQLIEDLLAYSRLSRTEIQLKSINLAKIANQAIEELKPEIAKTQAQITICEPLSTMVGNKTILLQVVSNLLSNALKFVPTSVRPQITISSEIITDPEVSSGSTLRLWIEDNGIGIERQHQERIFRVFERLHGNEAYPGTGIGLAIAKKGMERLGGRLGVESQLGQGSRFWLEGREIINK